MRARVPDVVVLVRPGRRQNAAERTAREIIRNDCFDRLRGELGEDFDATVARRVTTVAGDVTRDGLGLDDDGKGVLASCDIVIHAAASVSFDAPLDSAVEVNLLGPSRVAATLIDLVAAHRPAGRALPHLISVSTAYVSSGHRGDALEEAISESPYIALPDWRAEVEAARRGALGRRRREPDPQPAREVPQGGARPSSARRERRCSPSGRSACGRTG